MEERSRIASPCVDVCRLDQAGRTCIGCLRTVEEVTRWGRLTDAERARVIGDLPERHRRRAGVAAPLASRTCPRCGTAFGCGAEGPHNACWCTRYPPVAPVVGSSCLCPACLAAAANRG